MIEVIQIVTTFALKTRADEVGRELVHLRLVACAQTSGPVTSAYRWEGLIETSEEYVLTLKTRRDLFDKVVTELRRLHTYKVPEILAYNVAAGSDDYLKWLENELVPAG